MTYASPQDKILWGNESSTPTAKMLFLVNLIFVLPYRKSKSVLCFPFVLFRSARLPLSCLCQNHLLVCFSASLVDPDLNPSVAAVYNSYWHFSRPRRSRFSFRFYRPSARLLGAVFVFLPRRPGKGKVFHQFPSPLNENTTCEKDNMKLKVAVIT